MPIGVTVDVDHTGYWGLVKRDEHGASFEWRRGRDIDTRCDVIEFSPFTIYTPIVDRACLVLPEIERPGARYFKLEFDGGTKFIPASEHVWTGRTWVTIELEK